MACSGWFVQHSDKVYRKDNVSCRHGTKSKNEACYILRGGNIRLFVKNVSRSACLMWIVYFVAFYGLTGKSYSAEVPLDGLAFSANLANFTIIQMI